jgi:protease-4
MAFLRNLLASVLGTLVALGILFFMFMVFITLAGSADEVRVKDHSVLELDFPYPIQEHSGLDPEDPFSLFFDPAMGLDEITKALAIARSDDRITGISIKSPYLIAGMAQTKALRDALLDFKESGKFVYAYADLTFRRTITSPALRTAFSSTLWEASISKALRLRCCILRTCRTKQE